MVLPKSLTRSLTSATSRKTMGRPTLALFSTAVEVSGESPNYHAFQQRNNPFLLEEKKQWSGSRFGQLPYTHLGDLNDPKVAETSIQWPREHEMTVVSCKNHRLTYRYVPVDSDAKAATRAAEIYQRAIDEITGNSLYKWHHDANAIRDRVSSGEYSIWGTYDSDGTLIAVSSAEIMRGQRGIHWIWGGVDPDHRGRGVWENAGVYMDSMIEKSGAQYGLVWMATTHNLSQRMIEKVGWDPVGCFPGGEFLGGSDGKFYRQNVIWYSKLFNGAEEFMQAPEDMVLTDAARRVAEAVL